MIFNTAPEELIDNFLALQETPDMKFIQQLLWCMNCSDPPRVDCLENHDVSSVPAAQRHMQAQLAGVLRAEQAVQVQEMQALARMEEAFRDVMKNLSDSAATAKIIVEDEMRHGGAGGMTVGINAVKAVEASIQTSESRAAMLQDALRVLEATKAEVKVKCRGEWRTFSLDLSGLANSGEEADGCSNNQSKLVLFLAFALSRSLPPHMSCSATYEVSASVVSSRLGTLPDVTIEFDEGPVGTTMREQWSKGWRRYSICGRCLESCHTQAFNPQPPNPGDGRVERGTVCLGRSSGKFYFILCEDMSSKFLLPLASNFKVVGRVTHNLSSLEEAVSATLQTTDVIEIIPNPPIPLED